MIDTSNLWFRIKSSFVSFRNKLSTLFMTNSIDSFYYYAIDEPPSDNIRVVTIVLLSDLSVGTVIKTVHNKKYEVFCIDEVIDNIILRQISPYWQSHNYVITNIGWVNEHAVKIQVWK